MKNCEKCKADNFCEQRGRVLPSTHYERCANGDATLDALYATFAQMQGTDLVEKQKKHRVTRTTNTGGVQSRTSNSEDSLWSVELDCDFRGAAIGETVCNVGCSSGRGKIATMFECQLHERCTLLHRRNDIKSCKRCKDLRITASDLIRDRDIAVAITTAPRAVSTLRRCVLSICAAGIRPIVFAEPDTQLFDVGTMADVVQHERRRGAWHNFRSSAATMLRETTSNTIVLVQDDAVVHPDTFRLVDQSTDMYRINWQKCGVASLYTPRHYHRSRERTWYPVRTRSLHGAVCLAFDRNNLEATITHEIARAWRRAGAEKQTPDGTKIKNVDTAIGEICNARRRQMWFLALSPTQHVATTSSLGHGSNRGLRNCNPCADFDQPYPGV